MNAINLKSLVEVNIVLTDFYFMKYCENNGIKIKKQELECIKRLLSNYQLSKQSFLFDGFFVGYNIKRISKEFDLLRVNNRSIINIELKSKFDEQKILYQCKRNFYYLNIANYSVCMFAYILETNTLMRYDLSKNALFKISFNDLELILSEEYNLLNLDSLFSPNNYLVSPFNDTERFVEGRYFLTNQQEEIYTSIKNRLNYIHVIRGGAGSGKSLLIYSLYKYYRDNEFCPIIVHCGKLNKGQHFLIEKGFNIIPIYKITEIFKVAGNNSVVIVDEAQRLFLRQLDKILKFYKDSKITLIFSLDEIQTLSSKENGFEVLKKINASTNVYHHSLTGKIRNNQVIIDFVDVFMNCKSVHKVNEYSKYISYTFVSKYEEAETLIENMILREFICINFTSSMYSREAHDEYYIKGPNTHEVIGQEFEKVLIVISDHFKYDSSGKIVYLSESYYDSSKMLYQSITRTKNILHIILVNNHTLLNRLIEIGI